jgi:hypothetical protein
MSVQVQMSESEVAMLQEQVAKLEAKLKIMEEVGMSAHAKARVHKEHAAVKERLAQMHLCSKRAGRAQVVSELRHTQGMLKDLGADVYTKLEDLVARMAVMEGKSEIQ